MFDKHLLTEMNTSDFLYKVIKFWVKPHLRFSRFTMILT